MTVALGWDPQPFVVRLAAGGDFVASLQATPPWPAGAVIELRFSSVPVETTPIVWPATIVGSLASWAVLAARVQDVLNADARYVRLHYTSGGSTMVWLIGVINVS